MNQMSVCCSFLKFVPDYSQCLPGVTSSPVPTSASSTSLPSSSGSTPSSTSAAPTQTVSNISPEWQAAYTKVILVLVRPNSYLISWQAKAAVSGLSLTDKVNLGTGMCGDSILSF